jgi:hypothetical protein
MLVSTADARYQALRFGARLLVGLYRLARLCEAVLGAITKAHKDNQALELSISSILLHGSIEDRGNEIT